MEVKIVCVVSNKGVRGEKVMCFACATREVVRNQEAEVQFTDGYEFSKCEECGRYIAGYVSI